MQSSPAMANNSVAPAAAPSEAGGMNDSKPRKRGFVQRMLHNRNGWVKRFARQDLPGWSPIITAKMVVLFYLLSALILLPLGGAILAASLNVKEYSARYDNVGDFAGATDADRLAKFNSYTIAQNGNGLPVRVVLTAKKTMKAPVYVYYQLNSYYQNYRRYVRSIDSKQIGGGNSTISACDPYGHVSTPGAPDNGDIDPCGLIAHSNFNDTITVLNAGITLDESNLAWSFDQNHLYSNQLATNFNDDPATRGGNTSTVPLDTDQHLMVWMRVGAHATVRKLYAVINTDIPAGTAVAFQVQNRYNTYDYGGAKYVVISTNSWVGGKNNFLGICYLVVGGISLLISIAFFCIFYLGFIKRRKFADLSELSWNKKRS